MHTDDPEWEDDEMTRTIDTDVSEEGERWIDPESEDDGWDDSAQQAIPPRPRGRLLRPLPLALIATLIAAVGFIGGVELQKGSEGGAAGGVAGGMPSLAAPGDEAGSSTGSAESGSTGTPSFGSSASAAATGTVTSVEGHTIYVKETDGTTVAVRVGDGATVTRDSNVAAKKVHPGDSVVVEGSKSGSTVKASSIAATESGVESTAAFGGQVGSESETAVESLFEE